MRIQFCPPWIGSADISKRLVVKNFDELQAKFFNWLFVCQPKFSSKFLPVATPVNLFQTLMVQPEAPNQYYDQVLSLVTGGTDCTLSELYGEECTHSVRWHFRADGNKCVARLIEAKQDGFELTDDVVVKRMFCAELFKFMRGITRIVDDTYSTSTQFAVNPVLTQLYACHLLQEGNQR